jgi:hypothetical protein
MKPYCKKSLRVETLNAIEDENEAADDYGSELKTIFSTEKCCNTDCCYSNRKLLFLLHMPNKKIYKVFINYTWKTALGNPEMSRETIL